MKRFPTVGQALEWLTDIDDPRKVPGIAEGTKIAVRQALGLEGEKLYRVPQDAMSFFTPTGDFIIAEKPVYDWLCNLDAT
jgi:hypothetical protein